MDFCADRHADGDNTEKSNSRYEHEADDARQETADIILLRPVRTGSTW